MAPGIWQILIIVLVIVLLFGGNKISSLAGDVAKGIKTFKKGMADEPEQAKVEETPKEIDVTPTVSAETEKETANKS